ncbi:MAG: class I SAM-dependent methyltransferase [Saprospiraceae bacterium]|nr:class I SAM-dependent methyltransferase [Saprospiraceae bacterium]
MKDWYKGWFDSPYYDLLYYDRDENEAREFVAVMAHLLKIDRSHKILDIPCGNGRHCQALLETGAEITGIDLSFRNINQAKSQSFNSIDYYIHDMRNPFRINYFDFVFNLFTSFGYFDSIKENIKAAKNISLNVKNGGILVFDYFNVDHSVYQLKPEEILYRGNIQFTILRKRYGNSMHKDIQVNDGKNEYKFQERVKIYSVQEIQQIFHPFNLELQNVFGNYSLGKFEQLESERMICIFKKQL